MLERYPRVSPQPQEECMMVSALIRSGAHPSVPVEGNMSRGRHKSTFVAMLQHLNWHPSTDTCSISVSFSLSLSLPHTLTVSLTGALIWKYLSSQTLIAKWWFLWMDLLTGHHFLVKDSYYSRQDEVQATTHLHITVYVLTLIIQYAFMCLDFTPCKCFP